MSCTSHRSNGSGIGRMARSSASIHAYHTDVFSLACAVSTLLLSICSSSPAQRDEVSDVSALNVEVDAAAESSAQPAGQSSHCRARANAVLLCSALVMKYCPCLARQCGNAVTSTTLGADACEMGAGRIRDVLGVARSLHKYHAAVATSVNDAVSIAVHILEMSVRRWLDRMLWACCTRSSTVRAILFTASVHVLLIMI